jgi:ribonuclease Z
MLWDCGEGTQRQLIISKLNFMKISRIFITHWHADHWIGLIGLLYTMNLESRKSPLYIYGPEAERFIGDVLDMDYWGCRFRIIPKSVPFEGNKVTTIYETKDYEISSIPTEHTVPSVAYAFRERDRINVDIKKAEKMFGLRQGPLVGRLKRKGSLLFKGRKINLEDVALVRKGVKVVYSGDTEPCENILKISENADLLIHDATFIEQMENRMHAGAKEAAKIAKKANVKNLVLTHFSRRYKDLRDLEQEAKKFFRNTITAKDFMRITVKNTGILVKK